MLAIDQWDMVIREVLWLVLMIKQVTQKIARLGCDQYLVGALEHDLNFSIGNNHYPNWLSFFCRGVGIPPTKLAFRQVNAEMAIFQQTLHVSDPPSYYLGPEHMVVVHHWDFKGGHFLQGFEPHKCWWTHIFGFNFATNPVRIHGWFCFSTLDWIGFSMF